MIAVDTNLLVYAHREDSLWHAVAYRCIEQLTEATRPWAIPWPCVHEFLAISTHPRIYNPPTPLVDALDQINAWMEAPNLLLLAESGGYWDRLRGMIKDGPNQRATNSRCTHRGIVSSSRYRRALDSGSRL